MTEIEAEWISSTVWASIQAERHARVHAEWLKAGSPTCPLCEHTDDTTEGK
jgi:hypothetical protein